MDGELTGDDAGHSEVGRGHGWTQRRVSLRVVAVAVAEVAWFIGDEEARWRSFGWRRSWPFPVAIEMGNRGKGSVECGGSRSGIRSNGESFYRADDGEPPWRSSRASREERVV